MRFRNEARNFDFDGHEIRLGCQILNLVQECKYLGFIM